MAESVYAAVNAMQNTPSGSIPHVMVDLETLGTRPGCVILSIGAISFKPWLWGSPGLKWQESITRLEVHVSVESCLDVGLEIDPRTQEWWERQSSEARAHAFGNSDKEIPIRDACLAVRDFFLGLGNENGVFPGRVWCHGLNFDLPILAEAMHRVGVPLPWHYRSGRDTRTLLEEAGMDHRGRHHMPIADCIAQAALVSEAKMRLADALGREVI